ncbi:MAG TPA: LPS assembly lipoprotein LptE [Acetobacteraceae bacterium]|nr:LPS assembly lipoprotein LptE [Acetobacteraceae bacterium]
MLRRQGLGLLAGLALAAALGGCGFHPMYAEAAGDVPGPVEADLAAVSIPNLPERTGQLMRNALQARLNPGELAVPKRYELIVAFGIDEQTVGILPDNSVTRMRWIGTGRWFLKSLDPQRTLLASGTSRLLDAEQIINNQYFASDLDNEVVQRRLAENLANQIVLQVGAWFDKHPGAGASPKKL